MRAAPRSVGVPRKSSAFLGVPVGVPPTRPPRDIITVLGDESLCVRTFYNSILTVLFFCHLIARFTRSDILFAALTGHSPISLIKGEQSRNSTLVKYLAMLDVKYSPYGECEILRRCRKVK